MCGILLHKKNNLHENEFRNNLSRLVHRGPDDNSIYNYNNLFIGHTRLSIIDLSSKGIQPMISECENYILSFNGEIYNYLILRQELVEKGYKFQSKTDSEVILNGYIEYGNSIFKKLDGIFAIIIFNKKDNEIIIARDSYGVKPLYYYMFNEELIISSETRLFQDYCEKNPEAEILFLSHGYIPSPNTIYKNAYSLLPGHYSVIKNNVITMFKFFDLQSFISNSKNKKFDKQLLKDSINKQLISDAKLGCFLSGGIDSSIITYYSQSINNNIETYSLNFEGDLDERDYQKLMIEKFNLKNKSKTIDSLDFNENINKFLDYMDQPSIDGFNTYLVSKLAKKNNAKVSFSGVGSDEIFFGYPTYKNLKILKFLKIFSNYIPFKHLPNKFKKLDYLQLNSDYGIYLSHRGIFSIDEISKILKIDIAVIKRCLNESVTNVDKDLSKLKLIQKIAFFEIIKYMEGQLLKDADVFGMANSIEIRVPFLDIDLSKNVLGINSNIKLRGRYNKKLLVDACKVEIPSEILTRTKKGFELPFKRWLAKTGINEQINKTFGKNLKLNNLHWSKTWALHVFKTKFKY